MCIGLRTSTAALHYLQSLADKNKFLDARIRANHQMNFATKLAFDSVVSLSYQSLGFTGRVSKIRDLILTRIKNKSKQRQRTALLCIIKAIGIWRAR